MSMYVASDEGDIGQFASNYGYTLLIRSAKGYKHLEEFFREGVTEHVPEVIHELEAMAALSKQDVAETARGLATMLAGKTVAVVHQGFQPV